MRKAWVHCRRGATLLKTYDFNIPETLNDSAVKQPTRKDLVDQAKTNLANGGLASPPYADIGFEVEFSR